MVEPLTDDELAAIDDMVEQGRRWAGETWKGQRHLWQRISATINERDHRITDLEDSLSVMHEADWARRVEGDHVRH